MRKVFKIFLYILGGILALILLVIVLLNTPFGKEQVRSRVEAFLRSKLKTEVKIGKIGYGLPKYVSLENVLLKDQSRDTLLSLEKLEIDIDMLKLLHKQVDVKQIELKGVHAHLYRNAPDTNFNFTYIINAFTGGPNAAKKPVDTAKKKSSSPLAIDINRVLIDDIHIHFDDHTGGTLLGLDLDHLLLKVKKVDLANMKFHVKTLEVAGLRTAFTQDTSYLPPKPDTGKASLGLIADNVSLKNIGFKYDDHMGKLLFELGLSDLQLALKNFDLGTHVVNLEKLKIDTTNISIAIGKKNNPLQAVADTVAKIDTTVGWHVNADNLDLAGINFKMDNQNAPRQKSGIDYQHLDMRGFAFKAKDILYTSDTVAGDLQHVAVKEQSGLDLRELRTTFNYNPKGAYLKGLYLQTSNTVLQNYAAVSYPSLAALKKNIGLLGMKIDLSKSIVGLQDILIFAPQLESQPLFKKFRKGHWNLEASLIGYVNALNIKKLQLSGIGSTEVSLNGRLNGLPDAKRISYDLNIQTLKSSREEMETLLPKAALASVRLPERFGVTGHVAGTTQDYNTELALITTDGNAYLKGILRMSPGKGREIYDMYVKTQNLNLGRILKKDSLMGAVTADFKIKGQGFDFKTMNAAVNGNITAAQLKGYTYHSMALDVKMANKVGDVNLTSADTNLHIQLKAHADLNNKYAAVKANLNIDRADLQALKLYKTELTLGGQIVADFPVLNLDYPDGEVVWRKPIIVADGKRYTMDSLYVLSRSSEDTGLNIIANLAMVNAKVTGKTPLTRIGDIIQDHIHRHYAFLKDSVKKDGLMVARVNKTSDTGLAKLPSDYNFNLTASITDAPLLHGILPGLTSMDSIQVDARLTPSYLKLNATVPNITYGTTVVQNGVVNVSGTDSAFTYKATVDQISQSKFQFWYTNIHGNLDGNVITTNVSIADSAKKERFALAANLTTQGDTQIVQLQPGLKLDYNTWDVATPNRLAFSKAGIYAQDFQISNSGQFIKINSETAKPNAPLKVDISNFLLANITQIISKDTLLANGVLGGNVTITKFSPAMNMSGSLQIENLSVLNDTIGNLKLDVNNADGNKYDTKLNINGNGNDIALNGSYYLNAVNGNNYDLALNMNALNIASVQNLSMGQIRNASGYLRGKLQIMGPTSAPVITGDLNTDQLAMIIGSLGAYFKMPNNKIVFDKNAITLNNFEMVDSAGNKGVITGDVNLRSLNNIQLDLHATANNWRVLHSTVKDNKVFYGDLLLTTKLDIKGTPTAPNIDGNLNILKNTKMTVVMPENNPQLQTTEGIVEFVDMRDTGRYQLNPKPKKDTLKVALSKGSNINVNINVDKAAEFSVIIDQASGDFVRVRGDASLNASVDPGGTMALAGNYELTQGTYQLNYNFIKRRFAIQPGSTITFAGDPLRAKANITAVYEANVPPYDLIQKEVPDQAQLNYYKQRLPFNVELHLKGRILKPSITFNVVLPDNKVYPLSADQIELIQGKLSQIRADTSELNKQVFALLILSRFVSDDPFSSGAGSSLSSTALQSVSTFIGEQLNQLTSKLVKGVDVNVDLASTDDYTTGALRQRTDLNVEASKRLLNDRLKLTVGNDFELEGPQTNNNSDNNYLPTNLAADYLLSADGRYTVRAYRRNYDEGVLEGYVTETGVNFIVSLDYNHFRNVFRKKNHKKEQKTESAH